jgi:hypothetical protein
MTSSSSWTMRSGTAASMEWGDFTSTSASIHSS